MSKNAVLRILSVVLAALILLATAGKINDPRDVAKTIAFLLFGSVNSAGLPILLAYVVIGLELFVGTLLVIRRPTSKVLIGAFVMILGFTLALLVLARNPSAPDCGCFSVLQFATDASQSARMGIIRNALLLFAIGWMISASIRSSIALADQKPSPVPVRSRDGGFTIIELLVTIAIISILIALALPSLAGSRLRAKMTWSLSTQRQVLASVFIYTLDHDDTFPHFGMRESGTGAIRHDGDVLGYDYFQTHLFYWASLIYPNYFDNLNALSYTQDVLGLENQVRSNFLMTYNAWADPRLWNEDAPEPVARLLRATRTGEILFPSDKGLLLDIHRGALNQEDFPGYRNLSIGRADGSAGELDLWSVEESAVFSHPDAPVWWPLPVLATRDGLAGQDF